MLFTSHAQYQWLLPILLFPSCSFQVTLCPAPSIQLTTPVYQSCLAALQTLINEGQRENLEWPFRWRPKPMAFERDPTARYCGQAWSGGE